MPVYRITDRHGDRTTVRCNYFYEALEAVEDMHEWHEDDLPLTIAQVPWGEKIAVDYSDGDLYPPSTFPGAVWDPDEATLTATAEAWDDHYEGQVRSICSTRWEG